MEPDTATVPTYVCSYISEESAKKANTPKPSAAKLATEAPAINNFFLFFIKFSPFT